MLVSVPPSLHVFYAAGSFCACTFASEHEKAGFSQSAQAGALLTDHAATERAAHRSTSISGYFSCGTTGVPGSASYITRRVIVAAVAAVATVAAGCTQAPVMVVDRKSPSAERVRKPGKA